MQGLHQVCCGDEPTRQVFFLGVRDQLGGGCVCYYLTEVPYAMLGGDRQADTPLETPIVSVIKRLVLEGFSFHPPKPGVSAELLSSTISWATYGATKEWARMPKRPSVDHISTLIEKMVNPIFMSLE